MPPPALPQRRATPARTRSLRPRLPAAWAGAVAAALLLSACCPPQPPQYILRSPRYAGLPCAAPALVAMADRLVRKQPADRRAIDRAMAALEKALLVAPADPFPAHWRLARALFQMTETIRRRDRRLPYARRGLYHAREARKLRPDRVEPHYYEALHLARIADATADVQMVPEIVAAARRAAKCDETYDDAGPLVLLGKIYVTAPAWPVSVGNPEKAIEVLERALAISPHPRTRLFLGQALYQDERYEEARQQLERALREGARGGLEPRWQREARNYLRRIQEEM